MYGQLGNGTPTNSWLPVRSAAVYDAVAIAAGWYHAVALKADGTVWDWGYNGYGQLGNGTTNTSYVAVRAIGVTNAIAVAAGQYHTLAVKMDGTVMAWGRNNYGQLGDGTTTDRYTPVLSNFANAVSLAAGNHTLVMDANGTLWGVGLNTNGQLGNGTTVNTSTPTAVVNFTLAAQVATPVFTPEGGSYSQAQNVVVTCATYGASIHYTTNGNLPTEADPVVVSGSSLNIQVTTILRSRAFMIATPPSDTNSALYLIGVQPGGNGPVITITYPTIGIRQL
jgi:alpha-tubulin suppressor-like RCC1 family protein